MSAALSPWRVTRVLPVIAGESLDGYVARVAAAHHMPRMAQITEVTGEIQLHRPHASFCDDAGLQVLADCLGVSPETIRMHSPFWSPETKLLNFFGTLVPRGFLQFSYRRFSPNALSTSAHHRGLWQFRQLPICTEAWEYLEERCPNPFCRRRQVWRRTAGIDLCDYCAEPLTRAQATSVPESLRDGLKMLVGLIHHDPDRKRNARRHLSPALAELDGGHLLELACVLAPVVDGRVASLLKDRSLASIALAILSSRLWQRRGPFLPVGPAQSRSVLPNSLTLVERKRAGAPAGRSTTFSVIATTRHCHPLSKMCFFNLMNDAGQHVHAV